MLGGEAIPPPKPIAWYPGLLAWRFEVSRAQLRGKGKPLGARPAPAAAAGSGAAAEAEAEAEAAEAVRLRDRVRDRLRARESLREMQAEATKADEGGAPKRRVSRAQSLAEMSNQAGLSGAIARLEAEAAEAEAGVQAAQAKLEAARAARRARAAEELRELSSLPPNPPQQPSPYKYGGAGAPLAQPTRGGGGDETMQAQVSWLARGGSEGGVGNDETLSPDGSPSASHYASHSDPTPKPPPGSTRRLSLSALVPRKARANSAPSAGPARGGLLSVLTAGRLRRGSSRKASSRAAIPQRLASFDDDMRA